MKEIYEKISKFGMIKIFDQKKISLHRPGIEPESREWESRMITITPTVPFILLGKNQPIFTIQEPITK